MAQSTENLEQKQIDIHIVVDLPNLQEGRKVRISTSKSDQCIEYKQECVQSNQQSFPSLPPNLISYKQLIAGDKNGSKLKQNSPDNQDFPSKNNIDESLIRQYCFCEYFNNTEAIDKLYSELKIPSSASSNEQLSPLKFDVDEIRKGWKNNHSKENKLKNKTEFLIDFCTQNNRLEELKNRMEDIVGPLDRNTQSLDDRFGKRVPPKVFISYCWEPDPHKAHVGKLADYLYEDGIDCEIDQYHEHNPPPRGWAHWMEEQIRNSDFVLVICTETYKRRVDDREDRGHGVQWESFLIYQEILDARAQNKKFIPIVFDDKDIDNIPPPIKGGNIYNINILIEPELSNNQEYDRLYRQITNQPRRKKPRKGNVRVRPPENK